MGDVANGLISKRFKTPVEYYFSAPATLEFRLLCEQANSSYSAAVNHQEGSGIKGADASARERFPSS
jgi:hypothetical protein